jgi:hypothetical protein
MACSRTTRGHRPQRALPLQLCLPTTLREPDIVPTRTTVAAAILDCEFRDW